MRYYISDLHFFHENLNTRMDRRGFASTEAMHAYILERWNSKVRPGDEVVILGDVSVGTAEETTELLKRLNGRLCLITGNHDHFVKHRKFDPSVFCWIRPYEELRDNKRRVVLCHYPIFCYNGQYLRDEEGNARTWMLYGHVHDTKDEVLVNEFINRTRQTLHRSVHDAEALPIPCQMINCFCMFSDYTPLTLDEWIEVDGRRRNVMNSGVNGQEDK